MNYDLKEFTACMADRGYRLDANGYRAVWFTTHDGRHFLVRPDRLTL